MQFAFSQSQRLTTPPHGIFFCKREAAIPAYAPTILCDYGSEQLSERFDPPFVSFNVSLVIGRDRLSCGTQTSVVIEA